MKRQVFLVGASLLVLTGCERERLSRPEPSVSQDTANYHREYGRNNDNQSSRIGQANQNTLRAMDSDFLREAAAGNQKEVELGRIAVKQAQNDKVRDFGQRMIDDHTRMLDEARQLARTKGLELSDQLQASAKSDMTRLSQVSGADFDREYLRAMIADHEKDADAFDREARTGDDASVRSLAARSLPTIREHLRMARDIEQNMTGPMLGQPRYNAPRPTPDNMPTPTEPTTPGNPGSPTNPNNPDNPTNTPGTPGNPGTPGTPENPR